MKDRIRSRFLSPDVLGVGALLLFVLLRFLPVVLLARLYAPFRDNVFIYGPMFSETARIALHGEYPFYLPSFGTGFPLFQSPHYSPAYPFYFFGLLDYGGPLRSLYVLTYLSILHRVILGLNFYVMLRCARLSPLASFLAAALGIFAYNTEVYAGWITISASYTWLPLAIAGGILLLRNHRRTLGIVLLGVGSGLLALASASQAIAHALLFFGIFFVAGLGWVWRRDGIFAVSRFALALVCAGLLALGIGGVSAIPVYLGLGEMIRHIGHGYVLGHDPIPWSRFNETQLALRDWTALFWNAGAVEVVGSPYIGPLGLAGLVLCGLGFGRLDSLGKFLALTGAAIGLYALGSAFGSNLGFSYLNYHLPFLSKIREAGRYLVLFVVAVVLLVGLGFDRLEQALKEPRGDRCSGRRLRFGAGLLLLIFIALTAGELVKNARVTSPGSMVLLLTPILLLWGLLLRTGKPVPFLIAALLVSFASLISPPRTFPLSGSEFTQKHNLDHLRVLSALRERLPAGDYRLDFVDAKTSPFTWGMNASYFGFNSFYNRLTPQPYDQYRFSVRLGSPLLHELMGARYVLSGAGETPRDPAAKRLFDLDNYTLYENPTFMSEFTVIHSLAGSYPSEAGFLGQVKAGFGTQSSLYVPRADVSRLQPYLKGPPTPHEAEGERINVTERSVNKARVEITLAQPAVIVFNEWFTPAWKARVNGVSEEVVRVNQWQVGIPVGGGKNEIEFTYRPAVSAALLVVNRVTWLLLGLFLVGRFIGSRWRRWSHRPAEVLTPA